MKQISMENIWHKPRHLVLVIVAVMTGVNAFWWLPAQLGYGAWFIICYFLFLFLFGLPFIYAEFHVGKTLRVTAEQFFTRWMEEYGLSRLWLLIPLCSVAACLILLAGYLILSDWLLHYLILLIPDGNQSYITYNYTAYFFKQTERVTESLLVQAFLLLGTGMFWRYTYPYQAERVMVLVSILWGIMLIILLLQVLMTTSILPVLSTTFRFAAENLHRHMLSAAFISAFFSFIPGSLLMLLFGCHAPDRFGKKELTAIVLILCVISLAVAVMVKTILTETQTRITAQASLLFIELPQALHLLGQPLLSITVFLFLLLSCMLAVVYLTLRLHLAFAYWLDIDNVSAQFFVGILVMIFSFVMIAANTWLGSWLNLDRFAVWNIVNSLASQFMLPLVSLGFILCATHILPQCLSRHRVSQHNATRNRGIFPVWSGNHWYISCCYWLLRIGGPVCIIFGATLTFLQFG